MQAIVVNYLWPLLIVLLAPLFLPDARLARAHVEVIGRLPDYATITGFVVAPVVALVHPPFALVLDTFEVAEVFEMPLAMLVDPSLHEKRLIHFDGGARHFTAMPFGGHFTWGATAAMLRNLYRFLAAQLAH